MHLEFLLIVSRKIRLDFNMVCKNSTKQAKISWNYTANLKEKYVTLGKLDDFDFIKREAAFTKELMQVFFALFIQAR